MWVLSYLLANIRLALPIPSRFYGNSFLVFFFKIQLGAIKMLVSQSASTNKPSPVYEMIIYIPQMLHKQSDHQQLILSSFLYFFVPQPICSCSPKMCRIDFVWKLRESYVSDNLQGQLLVFSPAVNCGCGISFTLIRRFRETICFGWRLCCLNWSAV